nr:NAD(P)H-hydrate epimerase [Eubacterium sp.]
MRYLYTGEEAKNVDRHAIETMGIPGMVLMEKAAMTVASIIMERFDREDAILFVAGTGNNGGDAVAAARILQEEGYQVCLMNVGDSEKMSEEQKKQMEIANNCQVPNVDLQDMLNNHYDLIVDGLFGIGLSKDVEGVQAQIINWMNEHDTPVISLDIPSGINSATGAVMGTAVQADMTVTFGVNKLGLIFYPGCEYAGEIVVANIGFPRKSLSECSSSAYHYELEDLPCLLPSRKNYSNKGSYGKVLVVAGSENMSGACFLAAKAAYSAGAGLVKVCTPECNRQSVLSALPEALFCTWDEIEDAMKWADVIVAGPGLGRSQGAEDAIKSVLIRGEKPLVLDGDGIYLASFYKDKIPASTVVTPHLKEL